MDESKKIQPYVKFAGRLVLCILLFMTPTAKVATFKIQNQQKNYLKIDNKNTIKELI